MKEQVVIVGGGPGGATSAMFLLREGIQPLIVEAETFPRYHIGESLTGEGGNLLRGLGLGDEMLRRNFPRKQGVNVFGQSQTGSWFVGVAARDENWKLSNGETWQFRRSEFDKMMLEEAVSRGARVMKAKATKPILGEDGAVRGVQVRMADGGYQSIESELLLDCSGQATWLANLGGVTGPKYLGSYDKQIAIFSQVAGAVREHDGTRERHKDNTLIFYQKKYHWAWSIPLDDEIVSVGIVVPSAYFLEKRESKTEFLKRELRELHPELSRRIPEINLVEDVHVIPNYSYQVKRFTGKGFMCVGDSHRFIDPIFSFGLMVAMREAQFMAPVASDYLNGKNRDKPNPFADYQLLCEKGIDVLEDALDMFWEQPLAFALGVHARYTDFMTDVLAGRIYNYEHQPSPAVNAFRQVLKRAEERERSYEDGDIYSVPIGSRFHPERASIWEVNSPVESTEDWLGPR